MKVQISKIKVTSRIRKEITKIDELADDISAHGLLNPITVMPLNDGDYQLLAGLRRLRAVEMLGHDEIAVNVISPANAEEELRIEISENEQREPFTFTEKMDFARLLGDIEQAKAKERMSLGGKGGIDLEGKDRGPYLEGKQSRDVIGEKIGMSGRQYDRAKYIADNASAEVIEELDNGKRSIRPTYDELRAAEKAVKVKENESMPDAEENYLTIDDTADYECSDEDYSEETEEINDSIFADDVEETSDSISADEAEEIYDSIFTDNTGDKEYKANETTDALGEAITPPIPNSGKRTTAEIALGTASHRNAEDSKEYKDDLRQIRDDVIKMAEYSRSHKRTIEEFQQVFKANAERLVDSLEHQVKFMDSETWAIEANKQIACDLIDELVQAIINFKEDFMYGNNEYQ
jgi:ParB-like chromosome segregation protein Spo0J